MAPLRSRSLAARLLRVVSLFVPGVGRRRWLEEWESELWHLENTPDPSGRGPSPLALSIGAVPHSLWERKEWAVGVLLQDVRFAIRQLARSPGFTAMAVLTMALGIGANTTIFSMTNAILLRAPEAIEHPERLVQLGRDRADEGFDSLAYPYYEEFRDNVEALESVAAYTSMSATLGRGAEVEVVAGQLVTGEYFEVLGLLPTRGRLLLPADDLEGEGSRVAVISWGLWQRRFAGEEDAVGRVVRVNGEDCVVVGIAPRGFRGTDVVGTPTDVWIPLVMAASVLGSSYAGYDDPGFSWLRMIGRIAPGVSLTALRSEVDARYVAAYTDAWGEGPNHSLGVVEGVGLRPEERSVIGQAMTLLSLVVAVVLAVACANLANLLLARGMGRAKELGVRVALGAGRVRLVRQLLTESLVLAFAGGVVAVLLTTWTARLVPTLLPLSLGVTFRPDLSVLAFAIVVSLGAGVVFGIVPAARASRSDIVETLKESSPLAGRRAGWLRNGLVIGQLAMSFVLLAVAGFLLRSLLAAQSADPGYNTRDLMTVSVDLNTAGYDAEQAEEFFERAVRQMQRLPGVEAVAVGSNLPFGGWRRQSFLYPEPRPEGERQFVQLDTTTVSRGYFDTLQIPLLAGGGFTPANSGPDMPPAIVVSEATARLMWPEEDAIGRLMPLNDDRVADNSLRVVGVVADVQVRSVREVPRPAAYLAAAQSPQRSATVFVRANADPGPLARPMRAVISELDPDLGVLRLGSLHERMGQSLRDTLLVARLVVIFGLLAVVLAGVGLYGVLSYVASSRTHEVGVRMALGAQARDVVRMFVGQAATIASVGITLGIGVTLLVGGMISSLLYGVSARDPLTIAVIAAGVLLVALIAAVVPAVRTTRVSPVSALRQE